MIKLVLVHFTQRFIRQSALLLIGVLLFGPHLALADTSLLKKADKQITSKKFKLAARTITTAMNSGNLSDQQMAQALYRRGLAYRSAGRHSSAIADLTGALWLGKLGSAERKDAYRQRAMAYEATGYKKFARSDYGKSGRRSTTPSGPTKKPITVINSPPPIPTFKTIVRKAKKAKRSTSAKVVAKPKVKKKVVIPAFRTSIATE